MNQDSTAITQLGTIIGAMLEKVSLDGFHLDNAESDAKSKLPDQLRTAAELVERVQNQIDSTESKSLKLAKAQADAIVNSAMLMDELHAAQEELQIATDSAESANRCKSSFLANMSHEIRTPMTAILGYATVLHETGDLSKAPPERVEAINIIRRNGEYLISIINDILDISKIEAGKMELELIRCSPLGIVADIQSLMNVRAKDKEVSLSVKFEGELPESIESDPTRLKQILMNLVGNAIKFTDSGSVSIVCSVINLENDKIEPMVQFDVIDTGIGMNEGQMEMLFQAFTQVDISTTRQFGGTGLGLNISKRLVEMLGGEIVVQSKVGVGSMFRVTIPTSSLEDVPMLSEPLTSFCECSTSSKTNQKPLPQLDCRILLAEDGKDNQKLISFILKKVGAKIAVVENGKLALEIALAEKMKGTPFDVVLMDMQMPVMDGYTAVGQLRKRGYSEPIIALTAHAMSSDRKKCIDAGCDDYATKPIDKAKLIGLIDQYVRRASSAA